MTLPDVLRHLAGPAAEKWAGAIIALSWAAVTAAQFTALRALLHSISGGMTAEVLYVLLAAGIVLHTALGGQRGILRADFLHTILLLGLFRCGALVRHGAKRRHRGAPCDAPLLRPSGWATG